jgi:hypothetical protein
MLMAFLMFAKWWKFITKKTQLHHLFIFNFQNNWIRFIIILKIKIKKIQRNLMLELFMCLMLDMQFQVFFKPLNLNFCKFKLCF